MKVKTLIFTLIGLWLTAYGQTPDFTYRQGYLFDPTTTISFDLPEEALVKSAIYDVTGRQIRTITNARYPAGSHWLQWNGKDEQGNMVASGIYVYRIVADSYGEARNYIQTRKMMLLK